MKIIYSDNDILVCIKPSGVVSTDEPGGMPERLGGGVRSVHRLDTVVAGLMVYARTAEAASRLSAQITEKSFEKQYLAVIEGEIAESGRLDDLLARDPVRRKTYVVKQPNRGVKEAALTYTRLARAEDLSLVRISLITGRTHQIRAQFSSRGLPLFGDTKYGSANPNETIALWSCRLAFTHPATGEPMEFEALPPEWEPWTRFSGFSAEYDPADVLVRDARPAILKPCPHAERCGGCEYQGLSYEKILEKKQKRAEKWLRSFGTVSPIIPADNCRDYRTRAFRAYGMDKQGRLLCGVYREAGRQIVPISACRLNHPLAEEIFAAISETKIAGLRQAQVRIADGSGDAMVVLSTDGGKAPDAAKLCARFPQIKTVLWEADRETRTLYGPGCLEEMTSGLRLRVYPRSFTRGNPAQTEKLYQAALTLAEIREGARVVDACCGGGTLGLLAAKQGARVLGIDRSEEAIREAIINVKHNQVKNIRFIHADAAEYTSALARSKERVDVLFLDPPRTGCPKGLLPAIEKLRPARIVFLCADLERMAEEIAALRSYRAAEFRPVDVLPYTAQIDVAALLVRK